MSWPPPYNHQEENIFCACQMCITRREDWLRKIGADNPTEKTIEEIASLADAFSMFPPEEEPTIYKSEPADLENLYRDIELYLEIHR